MRQNFVALLNLTGRLEMELPSLVVAPTKVSRYNWPTRSRYPARGMFVDDWVPKHQLVLPAFYSFR